MLSMDSRYSHPDVTRLWSRTTTYRLWLDIEKEVLAAQRHYHHPDPSILGDTHDLLNHLETMVIELDDVSWMAGHEETVKHDVVAFLDWLRVTARANSVATGSERWIHYGLTSSDVVDTAQGMRFREMRDIALSTMSNLLSALNVWSNDTTAIVGRTHGQRAELMEMRARGYHWLTTLATGMADLSRNTSRMSICKLSGPVGTYAHNPPEIESRVARQLGLKPHGPGASQMASRAPLAAWASSAALVVEGCAKVAHDLRLMNLTGELLMHQTPGQVGSSSMAHKNNPIKAEQLGGMARMARGYALMLQPLDAWLERDISSSSVERVAVPDLWHVVLHSVRTLTELLNSMQLNKWNIDNQIRESSDVLVADRTNHGILMGKDVDTARKDAMRVSDLRAQPEDAARLMRNYPGPR
jgi:adenylosuccinate lyase